VVDERGRLRALLLAWRRLEFGYQGRVARPVGGGLGGVVVEEWLPAYSRGTSLIDLPADKDPSSTQVRDTRPAAMRAPAPSPTGPLGHPQVQACLDGRLGHPSRPEESGQRAGDRSVCCELREFIQGRRRRSWRRRRRRAGGLVSVETLSDRVDDLGP
jgi:hypothetical protein